MNSTFAVGTKGQVTIAKEIRDALGVEAGWRTIQRLEGDRLIVQFLPPKHRKSLTGALSGASTVIVPSSDELERRAEDAWEHEAAQIMQEHAP